MIATVFFNTGLVALPFLGVSCTETLPEKALAEFKSSKRVDGEKVKRFSVCVSEYLNDLFKKGKISEKNLPFSREAERVLHEDPEFANNISQTDAVRKISFG